MHSALTPHAASYEITFIDDSYVPPVDSLVSTPVISPIKTPPKKAKCGHKRKQSENDSPSLLKPSASKKKKKATLKTDIEEVEVVSRVRGKSSSSTSQKLAQCNPFIFTVKDSFNTFVDAVADAADTMPWHLTMSRLHWRFKTPANLQPKLLTNEVGYQAMIKAVKGRHKDQVIFLYIPQPIPCEQACYSVLCVAYTNPAQPAIEGTKKKSKCSEAAAEQDEELLADMSLKSQIVSLELCC